MSVEEREGLITDAAYASSQETVEAIEEAVEENDDPVVADVLDQAMLSAKTTVSRLDWLRGYWHRRRGRSSKETSTA